MALLDAASLYYDSLQLCVLISIPFYAQIAHVIVDS
jgi:hypothetical protein